VTIIACGSLQTQDHCGSDQYALGRADSSKDVDDGTLRKAQPITTHQPHHILPTACFLRQIKFPFCLRAQGRRIHTDRVVAFACSSEALGTVIPVRSRKCWSGVRSVWNPSGIDSAVFACGKLPNQAGKIESGFDCGIWRKVSRR